MLPQSSDILHAPYQINKTVWHPEHYSFSFKPGIRPVLVKTRLSLIRPVKTGHQTSVRPGFQTSFSLRPGIRPVLVQDQVSDMC